MSELREARDVSTGELVDGRYRLDERIGEGGMARVYRADDTVLGRTVAVKLLRRPVDSIDTGERARSEMTLLASLNHHGLVTLYDARVSDSDESYLVMEYVEGITLRERISRGPIGSDEAAGLVMDIAEALHVAHTAGIVHRDIKPSNILLWKSPLPGREWRAKIADFGIAYLLDSTRVTTPGLMVGTAAYIAPEQARGAAPAPQSDIYALGIVLIEALTGTRPFAEAEGIGVVMARLTAPPTVPETLDEGWRHLLRWMTVIDPDDRPTAVEVAVAASRLVKRPMVAPHTDEPTAPAADGNPATRATAILPLAALDAAFDSEAAPSTRDATPDGRPARRRRWVVALWALGALLVAAVTAATIWGGTLPAGSPDPVPSQPVEEEVTEPTVVPTPADEGTTVVEDDGGGVDNGGGDQVENDNSGPGNNNGNGNGNNGTGGNGGNGNGNSGNGNGNGGNGNGNGGNDGDG